VAKHPAAGEGLQLLKEGAERLAAAVVDHHHRHGLTAQGGLDELHQIALGFERRDENDKAAGGGCSYEIGHGLRPGFWLAGVIVCRNCILCDRRHQSKVAVSTQSELFGFTDAG